MSKDARCRCPAWYESVECLCESSDGNVWNHDQVSDPDGAVDDDCSSVAESSDCRHPVIGTAELRVVDIVVVSDEHVRGHRSAQSRDEVDGSVHELCVYAFVRVENVAGEDGDVGVDVQVSKLLDHVDVVELDVDVSYEQDFHFSREDDLGVVFSK